MRPHDAPSLRARRGRLRRNLRVRLSWLPGWPVVDAGGVGWRPLGEEGWPGAPIRLTREHVATGTRLIRVADAAPAETLRGLPIGLLRQVDCLRTLLPLLTDAVHGGAPLPTGAWALLGEEDPARGPFADALSWWAWSAPERGGPALAWFLSAPAAFAPVLAREGGADALLFLYHEMVGTWPEDGGERVLRWLGDPEGLGWVWPDQGEERRKAVLLGLTERRATRIKPPPPIDLLPFLRGLPASAPRARKVALRLLDRLLPTEAQATPAFAYRAALERVAQRAPAADRERLPYIPAATRVVRTKGFFDVLRDTAVESASHADRIVFIDVLARLPWALQGPADLLVAAERAEDEGGLRAATAVLRRHPGLAAVIHRAWRYGDVAKIAAKHPDADEVFRGILASTEPEELLSIASAVPAPYTLAVARGLQGKELLWVDAGLLQIALGAGPDPDAIVEVYAALSRVDADDVEVKNLQQAFREPRLLCDWVLDGHAARLVRLWSWLQYAPAPPSPAPPPPPGALPPHAERLPQRLQDALARLAAWPEGLAAGERCLADDVPDPARLELEIVALTERTRGAPPEDPRCLRLERLRSRLAAPIRLSPAREAKLAADLERAIRAVRLERWETAAKEAAQDAARARLGVALPAAALASAYMPALVRLLAEPRETRQLAGRVLRQRAGPGPWVPLAAPENTAFLERMRRRGVDVDRWVSAAELGAVQTEDGREVCLQLEPDPLEVLRMGEHFSTCLKPGGINFFSVFANAADANKRVVYGRLPDGSVMCRILLALTQEGGLLAFHMYTHGDPAHIVPQVEARLRAFAAQLRTVAVARGVVETLVAQRWYDDGPVDLGFMFPPLEEGSTFRAGLATVAPDQLVAVAEAAFAPLPWTELTVGLVIGLPELLRRPELLPPLVPWLERMDAGHAGWAPAVECLGARDGDAARRLLRARAEPFLARPRGAIPDALAELMIEHQPDRFVRRLSQYSRCARCERWTLDATAAWFGARAWMKLGRPARARELCITALSDKAHYSLGITHRAAAAALRAELEAER